ncbi:MAG: SWIM zinc finger family protein [Verrucomicrobiota bacterium]
MSFPDIARLAVFPPLLEWLRAGLWREMFHSDVQRHSRDTVVESVQVKREVDSLLLDAGIRNSATQPYRTKVYLYFSDTFSRRSRGSEFDLAAHCTCPDGINCKHAVAVLEKLHTIVTAVPNSNSAVSNAELTLWIDRIKLAGIAACTPPKPAKPYAKFLAYCIEQPAGRFVSGQQNLHFAMRVATRMAK